MSIDRIAALLAKAERTDNEAEAEAYLMKAQQLATLASIDLAVARARTSVREARQQPMSRTTTIGERGKRANTHLVSLYIAIAHANDAKVDIARNSTYVIGYGMPSDLDVIATMFGSLAVHMVESSQRYLATGEWKAETYVAIVQRRARVKAHTAQTARAAFYQAYVRRIDERLREARERALTESPAMALHAPGASPGDDQRTASEGALVLQLKEREVAGFHSQTSQARGSWGGYSGGVSGNAGSATAAGRTAASRARLAQQQEVGGKGPGVGPGSRPDPRP